MNRDDIIGVILNTIKELWTTLKEYGYKGINILYTFILNILENHTFSVILLGVWFFIISLVNIPSNWDEKWKHGYYFFTVVFFGLILFRFEYERVAYNRFGKRLTENNENILSNFFKNNNSDGNSDKVKIQEVLEQLSIFKKKAQDKGNTQSFFTQTKLYFKYLGVILSLIVAGYICLHLFNALGNQGKVYISYLCIVLLFGVVLYLLHGMSSKRQLLKPAWAKTQTSVLKKEETKIDNNKKDKGFVFTRILVSPFLFLYYFLYSKYCDARDLIRDLRDEKKRKQYNRKNQKIYSKYKQYIIVIIVCCILLYFQYLNPYLKTIRFLSNKLTLVTDPIPLDVRKIVGPSEKLYGTITATAKHHEYTYSLSLWVFLEGSHPNHNVSSNKNANIIDYGEVPKLVYNVRTNTLSVFMKHGKNSSIVIYETKDIKLQVWNYFVFNYVHGVMDVFLNGVLVGTSKDVLPVMSTDDIYVGDTNGIRGGVKDIIFSKTSRTYLEIQYEYYSNQVFQYLL